MLRSSLARCPPWHAAHLYPRARCDWHAACFTQAWHACRLRGSRSGNDAEILTGTLPAPARCPPCPSRTLRLARCLLQSGLARCLATLSQKPSPVTRFASDLRAARCLIRPYYRLPHWRRPPPPSLPRRLRHPPPPANADPAAAGPSNAPADAPAATPHAGAAAGLVSPAGVTSRT